MRGHWTAVPMVVALSLASAGVSLGAERYEDPAGDAIGDAPDIVAIEIDEPEGSVLRFSVVFASEPLLAADEAGTDILWLALDTDPEVTFPELDGFSITALGATVSRDQTMGGHLLAGGELYWHVVDVATDGPIVTFRLDRKLLGDPVDLWLRVYSAVLQDSLYTEQVDHYPDEGEPALAYRLSREQE